MIDFCFSPLLIRVGQEFPFVVNNYLNDYWFTSKPVMIVEIPLDATLIFKTP